MQLFSIGLWELNLDGSYKTPRQSTYTNDDIRAFSRVWTGWNLQAVRGNLMMPQLRGNAANSSVFGYAAGFYGNLVDSMKLTPQMRDKFPKSLLGGAKNLGDSYPLCSQLPARHFLQSGSKYRYHGTTSTLGELYDNAAGIREHFSPDPTASELYAALCSASSGRAQRCTFPPVVTLTSTLSCNGATECAADTLKAVKIVDGDTTGFYTYVEPPCVRLQFYEGGRRAKYASQEKVCADPETVGVVGAQCCYEPASHPSGNPCPSTFPYYVSNTGDADNGDVCQHVSNSWSCPTGCQRLHQAPWCTLNSNASSVCHLDRAGTSSSGGGECKYVSEAMTYGTAAARCAAEYPGSSICPANPDNSNSTRDGSSADWQTTCGGFQFSWTQEPCKLQVQVQQSGEVSVVDRSTLSDHLKVDSGNNFPVSWGPSPPGARTNFPAYSSACTAGCQVLPVGGGSCLCEAHVVDTPLVSDDPNSGVQLPPITALRAALHIGASPPGLHGSAGSTGYTLCTASLCTSRAGVRVYTRGTKSAMPAALDIHTVFELVDTPATTRPSARTPTRYLLNRVSTVQVGSRREYQTLNPTLIQVASCTASSESSTCSSVSDGEWSSWDSDPSVEASVGAWIQLDLDTEQEVRVVTVQPKQRGYAKDVRLHFSDGSNQLLTLNYTADSAVYPLAISQSTSFVRITVLSLHTLPCVFPFVYEGMTYTECANHDSRTGSWCAIELDEDGIETDWGDCSSDGINTVDGVRDNAVGTGFREIRLHGPGMASVASSTPCEDVGLLPVGQTECEAAHPFVARPHTEVKHGPSSSNIVRHDRWTPPGCSSAVEDAPGYDGDDAPFFNTRPQVTYWNQTYWPVCRIPSTQSDLTGFHFRNPVHFLLSAGDVRLENGPFGDGSHLAAAAEHETEALLDHLFEHDNTAPFVAYRMIQRLVTSNPTPRYIRAVATAFQEGSVGGTVFSGKYGCMASTVAAILLDREARSSILDRDPIHGQLREPLLKVMHVMRAMEYAPARGMEVSLSRLPATIGQMAFQAPSVFGYYLPEYSPNGIIADAGLVAPEAQLATTPMTIGLINGISSLIDHGMTSCGRGFGPWVDREHDHRCSKSTPGPADGYLRVGATDPADPKKTIDELSVLLTAGRMGTRTRGVIEAMYTKDMAETELSVAAAGALAVARALKLITVTPEFHATSIATPPLNGPVDRPPPQEAESHGRSYKAVVVVYLAGGADSYGMVVPVECGGGPDLHAEYSALRGVKSLSKQELADSLIRTDKPGTSPQVCDVFGLHPKLRHLRQSYVDGDAAVLANVGALVEPVSLSDFNALSTDPVANDARCGQDTVGDPLGDAVGSDPAGDAARDAVGAVDSGASMGDTTWNESVGEPVGGGAVGTRDACSGMPVKQFPPGVFAHNLMQAESFTVASMADSATTTTGVLGRMLEKMKMLSEPMKSSMYTTNGYARMLDGCESAPQETIDPESGGLLEYRDYGDLKDEIDKLTLPESESLFSETAAKVMQHSLYSSVTLGVQLGNINLVSGQKFPQTSLGKQLEIASKLMQLDGENGVERSALFTKRDYFDTHDSLDTDALMSEVDDALGAFVQAMKDQSMWDNVTVIVASEFGRSLSTNGQGTDHGWGGNYFVLGGNVKGAQMLGKYPSRLTQFVSEVNVDRGRFIPTTPWESMWNGVSEWWGIDAADRAEILPNMANFNASQLFSEAQLYKS